MEPPREVRILRSYTFIKDYFQSILRSLTTPNVCESHSKELESVLFVTNISHLIIICEINSFSSSFFDLYSYEIFSSSDVRKNEA